MAIWYGCAASHVYLRVPGYLALAAAGSAAVAKHPLGVAVTLPVVPELSVALARALRGRPVRLSPDPLPPGGSGRGAPEAPGVRGGVSIGFRAWAFGARGARTFCFFSRAQGSPGSSFRPALRPVLCGPARSGVCVCLCVFLPCLHVCVCAFLTTSSLVSHVVRVYSYLVRVTRRAIGPLQTHAIWQHGETWCPVRGVGVGVSFSAPRNTDVVDG